MTKAIRQIRFEGNVAFVPLTRGLEAKIDAADAHLVAGFNWYANPKGRTAYAMRKDPTLGHVSMHRVVMGALDSLPVDHIDGDGLNNRRVNLRAATVFQNNQNLRLGRHNTSGVKGVSWNTAKGKWWAEVMAQGQVRRLGYFARFEDACEARAKAAMQMHGGFFSLGVPSVFD
jgi:hypothetical protein